MSSYTRNLSDLHKAYSRVVGLWPKDKLRPTHCYKTALKQHMETKFSKLNMMRGSALSEEMSKVEKEISALESLVSNKYKSQYKLSESIRDPVSNKGYYIKLCESIDDAAKSNKKTTLRVD